MMVEARGESPEQLTARYLAEVEAALAGLPADRREEVVDGVRSHIEAELEDLGRPATTADVLGILDRLGPAEDYAEEAGVPGAAGTSGGAGVPGAAQGERRTWDGVLLVLCVGSLLLGIFVVPPVLVGIGVLAASMVLALKRPVLVRVVAVVTTLVAPLVLLAAFIPVGFSSSSSGGGSVSVTGVPVPPTPSP